jgi:hypothetical protein
LSHFSKWTSHLKMFEIKVTDLNQTHDLCIHLLFQKCQFVLSFNQKMAAAMEKNLEHTDTK